MQFTLDAALRARGRGRAPASRRSATLRLRRVLCRALRPAHDLVLGEPAVTSFTYRYALLVRAPVEVPEPAAADSAARARSRCATAARRGRSSPRGTSRSRRRRGGGSTPPSAVPRRPDRPRLARKVCTPRRPPGRALDDRPIFPAARRRGAPRPRARLLPRAARASGRSAPGSARATEALVVRNDVEAAPGGRVARARPPGSGSAAHLGAALLARRALDAAAEVRHSPRPPPRPRIRSRRRAAPAVGASPRSPPIARGEIDAGLAPLVDGGRPPGSPPTARASRA